MGPLPPGKREAPLSNNPAKPLFSLASRSLVGRLTVPGDKSISHRALLFGALSLGITRIHGLLEAEDVINTAKAVTALGAPAEKVGDVWVVKGRGVGGLREPGEPLDFGNSGTGVRLMMGVLTGHDFTAELIGDASLSRRPMGRVLEPLTSMGLEVLGTGGERLPLKVRGSHEPVPIRYELPVPSAQVKSAILLAGLHACGETTVIEKEPTRDHTERMLRYFGAEVDVTENGEGRKCITVMGNAALQGREVNVPADPSSAAFLIAAAVIVPGSDVTVEGVLVNPTRTGFYKTLREMGADLTFENERQAGGEPVADIRAKSSALKGVKVPAERAPSMIDEYPVLSCVAAFATGATVMEGLAELRVKESDRLSATAAGLEANGVSTRVDGDTLKVRGLSGKVPGGGRVETHLDHRIAMAFLTLGLASQNPVSVDDTAMIATSFPEFLGLLETLGAEFAPSGA
jgi:3-phosphoshikimate 1-carboxyvinyltransferase